MGIQKIAPVLLGALGLLSAGCGSMPQPVKVDFAEARPAQPAPALVLRPANGSLFSTVSYRPAFEDPRARSVGDTITIQIVENVTASQVSKSSSNRTSSLDASVSAAPLISPMDIANLKLGAASSNDFSGKGAPRVPTPSRAASPPPWSKCWPTDTWWSAVRSRLA